MAGRIAFEDRQQNGFPGRLKRIGHSASAGGLALQRKAGSRLEATGSAFAEPCAGGGDTPAVLKSVAHVESQYLGFDGFAQQGRISVW